MTCETQRNKCSDYLGKTVGEATLFPLAFHFFCSLGQSGPFVNIERRFPRRTPSFPPFCEIFNIQNKAHFECFQFVSWPKLRHVSVAKSTGKAAKPGVNKRKNEYIDYAPVSELYEVME
jgi:hypothetical protein